MIPRYRGKLTGGRPRGRRRRHRLAILIETTRILTSLALVYLAVICTAGIGLWLSRQFGRDLTSTVLNMRFVRQFAIQSSRIADYGTGMLAFGLIAGLLLLIPIHYIANMLIDDLVER